MKKRIFSAFMALVLIVAMYSGIRLSSVSANADEKAADVTLSVTTDKTDLRPGDTVTVTVKIDSFNSTISGDTDPTISVYQLGIPVDTDMFEIVSMDGGLLYYGNPEDGTDINYDADKKQIIGAASYGKGKDRPNQFKQGNSDGKNETNVILSYTLKVKNSISDNKNVTFSVSQDNLIMKNFKLGKTQLYSTSVTPAKVNVIAKELSSIEVSKNPTKTDYFTGSKALDVTGGKLKLTYTNGTSEEVDITSDMCSAVDLSTAGKKTVTVTYQGKTATFDVTVSDKKATGITLNGVNGKSIVEGTELDLTGMTLDVTYDDGSKDAGIALAKSMIKYDNKTVGKSTVTVTYAGQTQTFTIDVLKKSLTKIEMKSNPSNSEVFVGKTMDVSGAKITATYNNGTTEDIDVTEAMCSTPDTSVAGEKTVTVTYEGKTTQFKINVVEPKPVSLTFNGVNGKTVKVNKRLDLTGMTVTVNYNDGSKNTVALTEDMLSYSTAKAGTEKVMVTVGQLSDFFTISVVEKEAVSMELFGTDGKTIIEGMKLDFTGIKAKIKYDNDTEEEIDVTADMSTYDNSKVGKADVTVKYAGLSQIFKIEVKAKSLDKIEMASAPAKTDVFVGKTMDVSGAKIKLTYNNNTTENIDVTSEMCSAVDTSTVGKKTVTVTYNGKTTEFTINVVEPQPESVTLKGVEGKSVKEGKELDLTGMTAVVKYNDGSSKEVVLTKDMLSYSTAKAGKATVKVSVLGLNAEFTIDVVAKKPVSMKLSGTENKSVVEGMKLDLTGITAEVTYDNDTKEPVKVTEDMVSYKTDKVGSAEATVKIGDLTEKFSFTVVAKTLKEIKIVSAPTKVVYLEGQKFDSTGLSVQAVYDNGTTADVTKNVKLTAVDTAKAGKITVKVTYEDKVATFDVEVKTKAAIEAFNASVAKLLKNNITKADIDAVKKLRADYDAMSATEQAECNVKGLTKLEESVKKILEEESKANDNTQNSTENVTDNNGSSTGSSESGNGVKTGDAMNMYMYMILALLAGVSVACAVPYARRNRK